MLSITNPRQSRKNNPKRQTKKKIIVFHLGSEYYALPIAVIQQILDDFSSHGELSSGQGLVRYQDQTLTLIDPSYLFSTSRDIRPRNYLMVCKIDQDQLIGIPVPELPKVVEITSEQLHPLPELYQRSDLLNGLQGLIYLPEQAQEIFYLDLELMVLRT